MQFDILTVSKRNGWEECAWRQVANQTVQPHKWFCIHENPEYSTHYLSWWLQKAPKKTKASNLNASLNAGLRLIRADYVIFYQDFIDLPEDCFKKLLNLVNDHTFVTTCAPKYNGDNDSRYLGIDGPRPCLAEEWETNVA